MIWLRKETIKPKNKKSIANCFSNYTNFNGRGSRSEYWWFCLFAWSLSLGGSLMDSSTGGNGEGMMYWIATLVTALPSLAAGARRLHDVDKSGWWQLLWITIIGGILLIIWHATEGENKKNKVNNYDFFNL